MAPADAVAVEHSEITLGLLILLGIVVVVLLDLHFRWAEHVEDRQHQLEERVKELERRS